jgi:hypothetical protein
MSNVEQHTTRIKKVIITSYKLKDLAVIYAMTSYRMRRALKPHNARLGNRNGYFYTAEQVALIFKLIKLPSNIEVLKA